MESTQASAKISERQFHLKISSFVNSEKKRQIINNCLTDRVVWQREVGHFVNVVDGWKLCDGELDLDVDGVACMGGENSSAMVVVEQSFMLQGKSRILPVECPSDMLHSVANFRRRDQIKRQVTLAESLDSLEVTSGVQSVAGKLENLSRELPLHLGAKDLVAGQ